MKKYILLLLTGTIFGGQFMFTKFAIETLSPLDVSMVRTVSGTLLLSLLVPIFRERPKPYQQKIETRATAWYIYALIGLFECVLPCYLIPLGQHNVDSAMAAVLISTVPIFAIIFSAVLLKKDEITITKILSIVIGFIGVYILINPTHSNHFLHQLLPKFFILMAAACWGLSLVLIKMQPLTYPLKFTRNVFIAGTIEIVILWLLIGHPLQFHPSWLSFISAVIIGVFASGIVYIFYILLIHYGGVAFAALSNYIVPVIGVALGILFLKEPFFLHQGIGLLIIILALAIQSLPLKQAKVLTDWDKKL